MATTIPIFPLGTVLFPGGPLTLRIFEQRYLDLVRDCTRDGAGFGVCLIVDGAEAGQVASCAAVGTLARVVDFYTLPDGLLGITAQGGERFRVVSTRVQDNGLAHADVDWLADEALLALPPQHLLLATILERLHEAAGAGFAHVERPLYDDASWVGFRLAELLPLDAPDRQELLQLTDPLQRLDRILHILPRFQSP
jgi:Lon protease-like protein